ncbi:hypothetical protein BOX15_Mlig019666g1 [Macrostomum lignano]|uniref:SCP domain-containing protein n=2 Tax=Macrostomum lignano TaxID=282301 RepID=A0A1I8GDX8_9PLAT|nr:hypothetical protein BOX15_Mlig019666g1 [Macrostomum lignano]
MSKLAKFRLEALSAHNSYRKMHDVPLLEYDSELESSAQEYAEELAEAEELRVSHGASLGIFGENISRRTSSKKRRPDISGAEVTSLWYRDIEKFDYARGTGRAGNFTQLVWRDTRLFGIGKAHAPGRVVVVAHYSPAGNVRGHFLENVPPPAASDAGAGQRRGSREPAGAASESAAAAVTSTALDVSEDPLFNYRVKSRQVDTHEVREGRAAVVVRRELVEYEDTEGHTKQKLVEERQRRQASSSGPEDEDSRSDGSGGSGAEDETADQETSPSYLTSPAPSKPTEAGPREPSATTPNPATAATGAAADDAKRPIPRRNPAELHRFAKHVLAAINHHRKHHDARPLRLSGELCELAQQLAEQQAVSEEKLRPSSVSYRGQRLGQSLAARVSAANTDASAEHVVGLWYAEGRAYEYRAEPSDIEPFGNFTQLVWKASQELGVGRCMAQLPGGAYKLVVVCYYFPTGNVSLEFRANVLPPKK